MGRLYLVTVCVLTALWATGPAAATPVQNCAAAKQKAAGKNAAAKLKCYAKATKRTVAVDPACLQKAEDKFNATFLKAENDGGCGMVGDVGVIGTAVDIFVAEAMAELPVTVESTRLCAALKQKVVGKTARKNSLCYARATKDGIVVDPVCVQTVEDKLEAALQAAEAAGSCATIGLPHWDRLRGILARLHASVARFVDNANGTITDLDTGLMWEKKSDDGSIHDWDNFYTWCVGTYPSCDIPGNPPDGTAFTVFLATLNTPPCFAGHCDWRLPKSGGNPAGSSGESAELESILLGPYPCSGANPCVPPAFDANCGTWQVGNPGCSVTTCSCTYPFWYVSNTTRAGIPTNVWSVLFGNGNVGGTQKFAASVNRVRAVRGGS